MTFHHQGYSRYGRKRRHKRILKERYVKRFGDQFANIRLFEDAAREKVMGKGEWWYRRHPYMKRNGGFTYWQQCYLSGPRTYAKRQTNRRIRNRYRGMIANMDPENIPAYRGSDHEKEYDYNWTVW